MESEEQKPTARGVYYDVEHSPIVYRNNGKDYHFSSYKKRDMFIGRTIKEKERIDRVKAQMNRYGSGMENIDLTEFYTKVYDKVYSEMLIK